MLKEYTLELCTFKSHAELYSNQIRDHISLLNITFPGLIKQCPYRSFKVVNGIRRDNRNYLPNGTYKTVFKLFSNVDKNIFELTYLEDLLSEVEVKSNNNAPYQPFRGRKTIT